MSRSRFNELPSRRYYLYMMLPAIIVLACITIYPFFWLIWMSLHDVDVGAASDKWNDFRNWTRLARDAKFTNGWYLLIKYSAMCMVAEVGLGVALAVIFNRSRFEKTLVTIFLMPMMMAPVVAGLVWYYLYNSHFRLVPLAVPKRGTARTQVDPRRHDHGHVGHRHCRCLAVDAADHFDHAGRARSACRAISSRRTWSTVPARCATSSPSPSPISTRSC